MLETILIRQEIARDIPEIRDVNLAAFDGDAEAKLVDQLRQCDAFVPELSLVAMSGDRVMGHLLLTRAVVVTATEHFPALALAPMAVLPSMQRLGVGSMLVQRGLAEAASLGHALVVVLGHQQYYPRFGFVAASKYGIVSPFEAPEGAFMAMWLGNSVPRVLDGRFRYAAPFDSLG